MDKAEVLQWLSIIAEACSILGCIVSLFVASSLVKLSKSFNANKGMIQTGNGKQNFAKDHSMIATEHASAVYNDYSNATINGSEENKELSYVDFYKQNIEENTFRRLDMNKENMLLFESNFTQTNSKPTEERWIGYSIKTLPTKDWRTFVNENFKLQFDYSAMGTISEIWMEISGSAQNKKICKRKIELKNCEEKYELKLEKFKNVIEDWKTVNEICFVMFPEHCIGEKGIICITNFGGE